MLILIYVYQNYILVLYQLIRKKTLQFLVKSINHLFQFLGCDFSMRLSLPLGFLLMFLHFLPLPPTSWSLPSLLCHFLFIAGHSAVGILYMHRFVFPSGFLFCLIKFILECKNNENQQNGHLFIILLLFPSQSKMPHTLQKKDYCIHVHMYWYHTLLLFYILFTLVFYVVKSYKVNPG